MKDFKIGESVLFCNCYGDTYNKSKIWRYGYVCAGFITEIEDISARNSKLYIVGTISDLSRTRVVYRTLGEHLIFKMDECDAAWSKVYELCEEVEG